MIKWATKILLSLIINEMLRNNLSTVAAFKHREQLNKFHTLWIEESWFEFPRTNLLCSIQLRDVKQDTDPNRVHKQRKRKFFSVTILWSLLQRNSSKESESDFFSSRNRSYVTGFGDEDSDVFGAKHLQHLRVFRFRSLLNFVFTFYFADEIQVAAIFQWHFIAKHDKLRRGNQAASLEQERLRSFSLHWATNDSRILKRYLCRRSIRRSNWRNH